MVWYDMVRSGVVSMVGCGDGVGTVWAWCGIVGCGIVSHMVVGHIQEAPGPEMVGYIHTVYIVHTVVWNGISHFSFP